MELHHGKPKTAKDGIIHTLSNKFPLTAKQLAHILQREQGMELTYQAVHKALQELEKENVLTKTKNNWQINSAWLDQQATFIRQTRQKYSGSKNKYNIDPNYDGPQTFEFDNHTDFSVETARLVADKVLCKNKETAYFMLEYGWWTPKFRFSHLTLLNKLMRNSPKSCHIIRKVTPFGTWVQQQYERAGGKGLIGINVPFEDDMLVQGDWIVQVHFSPETKKTIEKYWNKWRGLEDSFKEFGLKEEPRINITTTVTRNPTLAKFLSQEMQKYVDEAKKHAK